MPASSKIVSQVHCAWQRIQRDLKLAGFVEKDDKFIFVKCIRIYTDLHSYHESLRNYGIEKFTFLKTTTSY